VSSFGDTDEIQSVPWPFNAGLAIHGLMVGLIQSFFAYRVYFVSEKLWLAIPGWFFAIGRTVVTWAIAGLFQIEGLEKFKKKHGYIVYLTMALSIAVRGGQSHRRHNPDEVKQGDLWITAALCFYLWSRKKTYTS
jgi:hypothetical protein